MPDGSLRYKRTPRVEIGTGERRDGQIKKVPAESVCIAIRIGAHY